jgi:perosamine synthetase
MTDNRIPVARPPLAVDDLEALRPAFESGWITMGPAVQEFEAAVARVAGAEAVATTSATSAMHLALLAWGIGPGDEVIVPAYTFVASAHAVAQTGATPVFCDVDPRTMNIDASVAAAAVTTRTRAIMAVHLFGTPAPIDALRQVCSTHDLWLLEDAACALGSSLHDTPCGALGDAAAFSFHPRKVITTGEGGMLTSGDADLLVRARAQRNHGAGMSAFDRHQLGIGVYPSFDLLGFNYRLTDLQARLGLAQMARLDAILAERRRQAARYAETLGGIEGLVLPSLPAGAVSCWQSFAVQIRGRSRTAVQDHLAAAGISAVESCQLVPALGYYATRSGYVAGTFPAAEALARDALSIPLFVGLAESDQERVVVGLREAMTAVAVAA